MLKITGYPDRYSVAPGEMIAFKVSVEEGDRFDARIVRVVHGDCNPEGPGLKFTHIPSPVDGSHSGHAQRIDAGSFMRADTMPPLTVTPFTFFAVIWPTLPERPDQTLATQWDASGGWRIGIGAGRLFLTVTDATGASASFSTQRPMLQRQWYRIAVSIDPARHRYALDQQPVRTYAHIDDEAHESGTMEVVPSAVEAPLYLAGCPEAGGVVTRHFDGKIDGPMLLAGVHAASAHDALLRAPTPLHLANAIIARWDFARKVGTVTAVDTGPSLHHGTLVHLPARAMKGWNWTGEEHDFKRKPEQYGAIHFHHDDVYDAGWETSASYTVPDGLRSGPYALHVRCGPSDESATREDYLAFFVRPPRVRGPDAVRPKVALLAPIAAYMAYANHGEHITARNAEMQMGRLLTFGHADLYLYEHPELGGSLYDCHADGSGVCYSSRLRPVLNFSARYHSWLGGHGSALYQYNADTHLFDWLDHNGVEYDLITDEDLHREGYDLLKSYRVILTGTHPEYHSTQMWDGMKVWIDRGGRLMYMGGNGWYWRIAFHEHLPGVVELRRGEDGIRTWMAEPGEYYHSFNGEFGGLWRRIGRPPNLMCGVGFIAQGFDVSSYYRRAPDAGDPRAAWIFERVPDEIIGDFGLIGGGAAGIELDCLSPNLGGPPNMLRLASSDGHSPMMMLVNEEFGVVPPNLGGDVSTRVRADLAFGETPAGGALFATSSIAWCGWLSHNSYDNNVSRITWNVLRRFIDKAAFPVSAPPPQCTAIDPDPAARP